jgi:hypothetical protein
MGFELKQRFFWQLPSIYQLEIRGMSLKTVFRLAELSFKGKGGCRII